MAWKLLSQRDPSDDDVGGRRRSSGGDATGRVSEAASSSSAVDDDGAGGDTTDEESSVPPDLDPMTEHLRRGPDDYEDEDGDGRVCADAAERRRTPRPSLLSRHPSVNFDAVNKSNNSLSVDSAGSNRRRRRARRIQQSRSRKRCMVEMIVLAVVAAGLIAGVAWRYSRQVEETPVVDEGGGEVVPPEYTNVEVDYGNGTATETTNGDSSAVAPILTPPSNVTDGNLTTTDTWEGGADNSTASTGDADKDDGGELSPVEMLERRRKIREALMAYTPAHVLDDDGTPEVPPSPQRRAMEWLIVEDPMMLDPAVDPSFVQRYVLATLYYGLTTTSTTAASNTSAANISFAFPSEDAGNGTSLSGKGNGSVVAPEEEATPTPPPPASSPLYDWTSGSSECTWTGVECGGIFVMHDDSTFGIILGVDSGPGDKGTGTGGQHVVGGPRGEGAGAGAGAFGDDEAVRDEEEEEEAAHPPPRPVIGIDLSGLGLRGTLPEEIGALLSLKSFDVSRNELEGPIPTTFGLLGNLMYLRLNNNTLSGDIPESIGNLVELRELEFGHNNLTGTVPQLICDLNIPDFGLDYSHSLPGVECSCCVGAGVEGVEGGGGGGNDTATPLQGGEGGGVSNESAPALISDSDAPQSVNDTSGQTAPP